MSRVYAISDLHVDHPDNLKWVEELSFSRYQEDVLLVAGDVTDCLNLLKTTLVSLKKKFKEVFFVPGNHELWIRDKTCKDSSITKFNRIIEMCKKNGIHTDPKKINSFDGSVWIVPLFSWYTTPEEDRRDSLYVPGSYEDVNLTKTLWMDNHMCKWPTNMGKSRSRYFAEQNKDRVERPYDAPVITFSHFVPRMELIRANSDDDQKVKKERQHLGLPCCVPKRQGAVKGFNFTRYAGCNALDDQLRDAGADVHVYGHQHRNRDRIIQGVRYVSHCLGYKKERSEGLTYGITQWNGPKQVWPSTQDNSEFDHLSV
ncbi:acyl-carrier-protein phosphodiesterase PptH-like [Antedon mediterranea]|uniref:acyl-carrier-protein phosphodiesterase PptH-like n=1 Tax=Antedon mediterranea TaxID=105859 RepID=UPI003AF73A8A